MEQCVDWRAVMAYRVLIIDDGMKGCTYFQASLKIGPVDIERYIESGGTIVYCGSFSSVGESRFTL